MLQIRSLNFDYGAEPILRELTLECRSGEVIGVVGESGVGKTTLLNLACGLLSSESGSVLVDNMSPDKAARKQNIGYVFQNAALLPWLTIRKNTALPLELRKKSLIRRIYRKFVNLIPSISKEERTDTADRLAVEKALRQSHILDAANKYPHELSGGMQTRAAIARTIVYRPGLLLLDEPFSSLDDLVKERLYSELQEIVSDVKCATMLVTHDLTEASLLCDRVYVLKRQNGGSSRFVHCEAINLPRPRTVDMLANPSFLHARARIRESLA